MSHPHKLLIAVREIDACRLLSQNPADTDQGDIAILHALLATVKRSLHSLSSSSFASSTEPSAH